jgi:hypothetical protein
MCMCCDVLKSKLSKLAFKYVHNDPQIVRCELMNRLKYQESCRLQSVIELLLENVVGEKVFSLF